MERLMVEKNDVANIIEKRSGHQHAMTPYIILQLIALAFDVIQI
tara:strand:- start:3854 stop:3985 length:132 start_codon:yes stop_codon:yes gene_type:complete